MMSRRTYVWSALALAAMLFCRPQCLCRQFLHRYAAGPDPAGTYTLSDGTRAIIAKLPEPVTLRFYFSKKNSADYPVTAAYAKRVRDLLGEYAALSHGKIILEDVDPEPFTPEEDQANAAGIRPVPAPEAAIRSISGWKAPTASTTRRPFPISRSSANPIWNMT